MGTSKAVINPEISKLAKEISNQEIEVIYKKILSIALKNTKKDIGNFTYQNIQSTVEFICALVSKHRKSDEEKKSLSEIEMEIREELEKQNMLDSDMADRLYSDLIHSLLRVENMDYIDSVKYLIQQLIRDTVLKQTVESIIVDGKISTEDIIKITDQSISQIFNDAQLEKQIQKYIDNESSIQDLIDTIISKVDIITLGVF